MDTNIYVRRKDKGYQYVVSYKVNGVWKQKSKQGFETSREAKKAAQIVEKELKENYIPVAKTYTFLEVAKMRMADGEYSKNSKLAMENLLVKYAPIYNKHIEDITYSDILSILTEIKNNMKFSTLKAYVAFGKSVFVYAIKRLRIINNNPFSYYKLTPPKKSDTREKRVLTESELDDLISKLTNKQKLITALMGYAGLRISEARGLKRGDISLADNEIRVQRQKDRTGETSDTLKSHNSYRSVPISSKLKAILKESPLPLNDYFPNRSRINSLTYQYKKAGYNISPHELRHTFATLLIQKGIDFKTVAMLIGDSVEMVFKVYSHVNDDMYQEAKKKMLENF